MGQEQEPFLTHEVCEDIITAIVLQALEDYRYAMIGKPPEFKYYSSGYGKWRRKITGEELARCKHAKCVGIMDEVERFFTGEFFKSICDLDGDKIVRQLREERERAAV